MPGFVTRRRRQRHRETPFPDVWRDILIRDVPYYALLTPEEQHILHGHIQILLAEKRFEGCDGFEITDQARVAIAALAGILLLHLDVDFLPRLVSILVYPDAFVTPHRRRDGAGIVTESDDVLVGESWDVGAVIFSWRDIERDRVSFNGRNVVFHEFAHQIDQANGAVDGCPAHLDSNLRRRWAHVLDREYEALRDAVERGLPSFINAYAAEKPSEFFAVVTEFFFERPRALRDRHPELYDVFRLYYGQDPFTRFPGYAGRSGAADGH
jgi:hypothetical protein